LEDKPESVKNYLIETFQRTVSVVEDEIVECAVHKWRYAIPKKTLDEKFLYDRLKNIGICGDWCGGPRVEGAFLSGFKLAEEIITCL